jgi:DNA (cytosine-5)-methyltransferase 1
VSHDEGRTFQTIKEHLDEAGYKFFYEIIDSSTVVPQRRLRCYMVGVRKDVWLKSGDFEFPSFAGDRIPLSKALDDEPDLSFQISEALWQGHIARTERNLARGAGFTAFLADVDKPSNTIVARYGKDGKECLIPVEGGPPRKLTFSELKRLFGFPANFLCPAGKTPAYRQFGNSVVVPVITRIAQKISDQYLGSAAWSEAA